MLGDDSTAYLIGDSIDSISTQVQKLLDRLNDWSNLNYMFIYPTKTEKIMFLSKIPIRPITLNDKFIACVFSSACLGVASETRRCWSRHIKSITSNFYANLITKLNAVINVQTGRDGGYG